MGYSETFLDAIDVDKIDNIFISGRTNSAGIVYNDVSTAHIFEYVGYVARY